MLTNINLISKKKRATKNKDYFKIILYVLFGIFTTYFVSQVVYVTVNLIVSGQRLNKVRKESAELSSQILKDNEKLNNYVLSKFILTEINLLRMNKFDYKDYLDQIVAIMPAGNEVKSVGFEKVGFVQVAVESANDTSFRALENNIRSYNMSNTSFDSILANSISRASNGTYRSDFIFRIKQKNGRK